MIPPSENGSCNLLRRVLSKHQLPSHRIHLYFHQLEIGIGTNRFGQHLAARLEDFEYQLLFRQSWGQSVSNQHNWKGEESGGMYKLASAPRRKFLPQTGLLKHESTLDSCDYASSQHKYSETEIIWHHRSGKVTTINERSNIQMPD